jgi:TldD protein
MIEYMKNYKIVILALAMLSIISTSLQANEEIMKAMRDEINRSMNELELESLQKPYFIEYKLTISDSYSIGSKLGAIENSDFTRVAYLDVRVRVGDYKFDNSNYFDFGLSLFGSGDDEERFKSRRIPYELDYETLRRELWLATDACYKQSAEIFSKKVATIKNRVRKDTTHDFLRAEPKTINNFKKTPHFNVKTFEKLMKNVSAVFTAYPQFDASYAGMEYHPETVYYLNSEGMEYINTDYYTGVEIIAAKQADDGMPLAAMYFTQSKTPSKLPTLDSLKSAAKIVADKLDALLEAPTLEDPYSGPVLFEGSAAAEIFAQVFASSLVTQRPPLTESGIQDLESHSSFQNKIGGRVLPEFLSIDAIPNTKDFKGVQLTGHFELDEQGIKPKDITLVKDGYLKGLLSDRTPTRRVRESNGHRRGGAAMLSNIYLFSKPEKKNPTDSLKARMLKLCKDRELEYGIVVRQAFNSNVMYTTLMRNFGNKWPISFGNPKIYLIEVYKVYQDGREELVRGTEAAGFTVQSFKDILNVGTSEYVLNYYAPAITSPFISGGDMYTPCSVIVPDILFEDGDIKSMTEDFTKPPLISRPSN